MGKRKVTASEKVEMDFANLQQKIKRDPQDYEGEFLEHWSSYLTSYDQFLVSPVGSDANLLVSFREQIDLIAHVVSAYPSHSSDFASQLKELLTRHHVVLETELREKIVSSLVLLRRQNIINSNDLLTTLFPILISTPSKTLRTQLFQKILMDLRNSNTKSKNNQLNKLMQTVLFNLAVSDRTSSKALWAVKLVREMWKRSIWNDAKTVEIMKECCLSENEKVVVGATRFFLGSDQDREEADESSDEETPDIKKIKHQQQINKKTKKKTKLVEKAIEKVKRAERKKNATNTMEFSALFLLNDPQGFAENMFSKHLQQNRSKFSLDSKLSILGLITRLVGVHKLTLLSLYSWFTKFLTPRQQNVTSFLASLAQAVHDLIPDDVIQPLIVKIANEFVSEASASEVAAAGLNAIRHICARQPLAMSDTLLQDLVSYRSSKDKGVAMAARGLLSLYRERGAELLAKKDRGKEATMNLRTGELKQKKFGEQEVGGIEGLELLEKWKEEQRKRQRAAKGLPEEGDDEQDKEEDEEDGWEVASMDSSDSGEWIRVSDSEDEAEPVPKKQKRDSENPDEDGDDDNAEEDEVKTISKLATTQILTPADLAKLRELRMDAKIDSAMGTRKRKQREMEARHLDEGLTAEQIEAPSKLRKSTKEERIAMAREGKPDRDEHKSTQAIRKSKKDAEGKSTTNKEKARRKNFLMTMGKAKSKQKRSLVDTRKVLKAHIERSKSGGRRRNGV